MSDTPDVETWEGEGGAEPSAAEVEDAETSEPISEGEVKVDWDDPSQEQVEGEEAEANAGVAVGLSPLGPVIVVTQQDGTSAQKVISVEDCFLLGGQLLGIGSFVMGMGMQQQMQEAARLQSMMQQGEEKTKSGLYVKRD